MSDLSDTLRVAQEDTKRLHEATEQLNAKIKDVTKVLADQRFGVSAQVELKIDPGGGVHYLGFGKDNNAWTLLYLHGDRQEPLTSAPRSVRLLAVKHLPRLLTAIREAIVEETSQVQQRIGDIDRLILAILAIAVAS